MPGLKAQSAQNLLALLGKHADKHDVARVKDRLVVGCDRHHIGELGLERRRLFRTTRGQHNARHWQRAKRAHATDDGGRHCADAHETVTRRRFRRKHCYSASLFYKSDSSHFSANSFIPRNHIPRNHLATSPGRRVGLTHNKFTGITGPVTQTLSTQSQAPGRMLLKANIMEFPKPWSMVMVHARARMRTSTCTGGGTTVRGTHANGQERAGVRARA